MLARQAAPNDADILKNVADNIGGRTICAFGEACSWPVQSFVAKFKDEFVADAASRRRTPRENDRNRGYHDNWPDAHRHK